MAYRDCILGMRVRAEPERAAATIMKAYRKTKGNTTRAAELLGVDRATLKRWVLKLNLRASIDELRCGRAA